MSERTFVCDRCGGTFPKEWSDEVAMAESHRYFGELPREDLAVVCDDCWEKVRPDRYPEQYQRYLRKHGHAD